MVQVTSSEPINPKVCVCQYCLMGLSYTPNDVFKEKRNTDYLGGYDMIQVITCPSCSKNTAI